MVAALYRNSGRKKGKVWKGRVLLPCTLHHPYIAVSRRRDAPSLPFYLRAKVEKMIYFLLIERLFIRAVASRQIILTHE